MKNPRNFLYETDILKNEQNLLIY